MSDSNKISKASPPITPLRGGSYIPPKQKDDRQPRWSKWRLMPEVEMWEAVALSLNIEPDKIETNRDAWMRADHPFDEGDEFNDRLSVLSANSNGTSFPTACTLNMGNWYKCGVRLDEFASWALSVAEWPIPDELKAIAAKVSSPMTESAQVTANPEVLALQQQTEFQAQKRERELNAMRVPPDNGMSGTSQWLKPMNEAQTIAPVTAHHTQAALKEAAPVVQAPESKPLPLTTGDIAFCFAGLHWKTEVEWKKPLGDKPKWLAECIAIPGVQGVSETRWNPVQIGAALVRRGHAKANNIRAKFQTQHQLKPWLETWKDYEAEYLQTE